VTTFGLSLAAVAGGLGLRSLYRKLKVEGGSALFGAGIAFFSTVGLAGLLLAIFPQMDHHWLNWLERAVPSVQLTFLTSDERETYRDSQEAVERGKHEVNRLRLLEQEVQWGLKEMSEDMQERLRQYLASRGEIIAGDRLVLISLQGRARERQRYWLGLPLLGIGALGAAKLSRLFSFLAIKDAS